MRRILLLLSLILSSAPVSAQSFTFYWCVGYEVAEVERPPRAFYSDPFPGESSTETTYVVAFRNFLGANFDYDYLSISCFWEDERASARAERDGDQKDKRLAGYETIATGWKYE